MGPNASRFWMLLSIALFCCGCGDDAPDVDVDVETDEQARAPVAPIYEGAQIGVDVLDPFDTAGYKLDPYSSMYNPATVVTREGAVTEVKEVVIGDDDGNELREKTLLIRLTTSGGALTVVLAPSEFLDEQRMKLRITNKIVVVGSRVNRDGRPLLVARSVQKGRTRIELREENGRPLWRNT